MATLSAVPASDNPPETKPTKKKLIRRVAKDHSQAIRMSVQAAFLLLNVWIGVQFYGWVRHFETLGVSRYVSRPA